MTAHRNLGKTVILPGAVAARGATMMEIRCGRCNRARRLSLQRLVAQYSTDVPVWHVMEAETGAEPAPRQPKRR
jgi:hypothetical protein